MEWRKSIDTRAARWLLTAIALLTAGAAMVPLFLPQEIQQGWPSYLGMTALVLALLLPLVSIMTLTSEWGQRSVLVTFTQEPRRGRVVAAKVLSGLALALLGAVFASRSLPLLWRSRTSWVARLPGRWSGGTSPGSCCSSS